ncbi:two component transcriptional regulator, LuxR family [Paenibacillus curdlanolyticus YK9]|uniref:Two component transcriptional regulator, LuxR family n=1 Tax=Paenibacillus curdlanolyticus YK9 TaxID=717606 RepID=E0I6K2_9BACL|nr:response regulator transcription factor [Paenibacillus curdlanolyticus]EFM11668.1 two component transcriptional regulator, LuxR family [Paenibacillus curdlanolyticus YK9]
MSEQQQTKQEQEGQIRVMLVEDDPEWRRGLSHYLSAVADLSVVAETGDPEQVASLCASTRPDVILLDIMLSDVPAGLRLAAELPAITSARMIMLTSMEDGAFVSEALRAGAVNYMVKSRFTDIPHAIRQAAADRSMIDASAAKLVLEELRRLKKVERDYEVDRFKRQVTPAEVQVLSMIHEGYSQSQIADRSFLSLRTVKNHVGNILRKIGVGTSKEAAEKAKDMGLF